MNVRDRWTSDVHGGSPQGLPSSKWRFSKLSSRLFACWSWRMCSWLNKMCSLQKNILTLSQQRSIPALTYMPQATIKFHLPTWPGQQRAYMCACTIKIRIFRTDLRFSTFSTIGSFTTCFQWDVTRRKPICAIYSQLKVSLCARNFYNSAAVICETRPS